MLRFNRIINSIMQQLISDFNTSYVTVQQRKSWEERKVMNKFQYILCYGSTYFSYIKIISESKISIHPMLRFNRHKFVFLKSLIKFQYILCYGSTDFFMENLEKVLRFQYILCYGSTQVKFGVIKKDMVFQYILCYGSTLISPPFKIIMVNFNTSYVTVQPNPHPIPNHPHQYFNTSYVTVQH